MSYGPDCKLPPVIATTGIATTGIATTGIATTGTATTGIAKGLQMLTNSTTPSASFQITYQGTAVILT